MSATCLCRSVVVSVNIFCLSVFVCELTFGQLSVGELSHNGCVDLGGFLLGYGFSKTK